MRDFVFTSQAVTEGHPDKLCDLAADAIVDAALAADPLARVVAECAISGGVLFASVGSRGETKLDVGALGRRVIAGVGYPDLDPDRLAVVTDLSTLSARAGLSIDAEAGPVAEAEAFRAGVNVTVFGYACRQTPELMPAPIVLARDGARRLDALRRDDCPWLHPDGQVQLSIRFADRRPEEIVGVSVSAAVGRDAPAPKAVRTILRERLIDPLVEDSGLSLARGAGLHVDAEGAVRLGGPLAHAGLTGRKTDIDGYGGFVRQSASAFSGKDALRVDRTGAYAARHAAKAVVTAGLADECEVQVSYAIGAAEPLSVEIDAFGTERVPLDPLEQLVGRLFDFRPGMIARAFRLQSAPQRNAAAFYARHAVYGQIGRADLASPWEDVADAAARLAAETRSAA
jgi:S-adenosylmethionine synthetase